MNESLIEIDKEREYLIISINKTIKNDGLTNPTYLLKLIVALVELNCKREELNRELKRLD